MVDFQNINLKDLGLYPIFNFNRVIYALKNGYIKKYRTPTNTFSYNYGKQYVPSNWELIETIQLADFDHIEDVSVFQVIGISRNGIEKLKWLQKYSRGEVEAPYKKETTIEELSRKCERVDTLLDKINKLQSENANLKTELEIMKSAQKEVHRKEKEIEKIRQSLSKILK